LDDLVRIIGQESLRSHRKIFFRQGDLSTLGNFFRENPQEIQNAGVALWAVTKRLNDRRQNIVPVLHLNR